MLNGALISSVKAEAKGAATLVTVVMRPYTAASLPKPASSTVTKVEIIQPTPYGSCTAIGGPSQNHWLRKMSQTTIIVTVQSTMITTIPVMTIIQRQFQW